MKINKDKKKQGILTFKKLEITETIIRIADYFIKIQ